MRAGAQFVRNTPLIRGAMLRCFAFALPASAPWALLPLVVREQLGLGPGMFGLILGLMGAGGVISGLVMPRLAPLMARGTMVFAAHARLLRRYGDARPGPPLGRGGGRDGAVRHRLGGRLCHDPGHSAARLPALGARGPWGSTSFRTTAP
jgi:hypothetical protein